MSARRRGKLRPVLNVTVPEWMQEWMRRRVLEGKEPSVSRQVEKAIGLWMALKMEEEEVGEDEQRGSGEVIGESGDVGGSVLG